MIVTSSAFPLFYSKYAEQEPPAQDPISEVDRVTLTCALRSMQESISQHWQQQGQSTEKANDPDDDQLQWSARVEASRFMCGVCSVLPTADTQLLYSVDQVPVGALTMLHRDETMNVPYVEIFVTHPGSSGAGAALLERAVKKSMEVGGLGQLMLSPTNSSIPAYEALGFTKTVDAMFLDPAKSEKWQLFDDAWRLINSVGERKTG